jgi:hypothetical protein
MGDGVDVGTGDLAAAYELGLRLLETFPGDALINYEVGALEVH